MRRLNIQDFLLKMENITPAKEGNLYRPSAQNTQYFSYAAGQQMVLLPIRRKQTFTVKRNEILDKGYPPYWLLKAEVVGQVANLPDMVCKKWKAATSGRGG
jgi:hypothetical protein